MSYDIQRVSFPRRKRSNTLFEKWDRWYNSAMGKSFFVWSALLLLLSSCSLKAKTSSSLDEDYNALRSQTQFQEGTEDFDTEIIRKKSEGNYIYLCVFSHFRDDRSKVRTLISLEDGENSTAVYFGYDKEYSVVNDESKKDSAKDKVLGYVVYATTDYEAKEALIYFRSQEKQVFLRQEIR